MCELCDAAKLSPLNKIPASPEVRQADRHDRLIDQIIKEIARSEDSENALELVHALDESLGLSKHDSSSRLSIQVIEITHKRNVDYLKALITLFKEHFPDEYSSIEPLVPESFRV